MQRVTLGCASARYTGSSAFDLAYTAAGRYDAGYLGGVKPWDIAAGLLLVREAGGLVTDLTNEPAGAMAPSLLAASQGLHRKSLKLLAESSASV